MNKEKLQEQYEVFCDTIKTVVLGTVDSSGAPTASYTLIFPHFCGEQVKPVFLSSKIGFLNGTSGFMVENVD